MRSWNSGNNKRLAGIFRLCLCLVVAGIIILGAADRTTAASSAAGSLPVINVFSANPLTLKDGDSAKYMFEVSGSLDMKVVENGVMIKEIKSPANTRLKGTVMGMTTYEIRSNNSNKFETTLEATNSTGTQIKTLTLSFVTVLPPISATQSAGPKGSDNRTPLWGPQRSAPASSTSSTALSPHNESPYVPTFAACPGDCNCLTPDQAAQYGFTQKCSEQRCFSADNGVKSYCYSEPSGWFCSGGKVQPGTKAQATQAGATWYANQADAVQACQPVGWCCRGGQIAQTTQARCSLAGGDYWSTDENQVIQACQQMLGWFCSGGQVYQGSQAQAAQAGATWYANQAQALRACQQTYWCCRNGEVYQSTSPAEGCYTTQAQAVQACQRPTPTPTPTPIPKALTTTPNLK